MIQEILQKLKFEPAKMKVRGPAGCDRWHPPELGFTMEMA
jgi:hypothetical protein